MNQTKPFSAQAERNREPITKGGIYGAAGVRAGGHRAGGLNNGSVSLCNDSGRGPQPASGVIKRKLKPHSQWNHPRRKPCGCLYGSCLECRRPDNKGYWSAAEVAAMRADYDGGMTAAAVERKHGVAKKGLRNIFERRGIPWRKPEFRHAHNVDGRFVRNPAKTPAEIAALIRESSRLVIPRALKQEWKKHWSASRKKNFVRRLRNSLRQRGHKFAPEGKASANVVPFDYFTAAARAIVAAANVGRNSQTKAMQLKPSAQGMIFEGELWYWAHDGYQRQSHGHPERGGHRPFLHRHLYERFHGPIPDGFTVIQRDGNKNNFDPKNLVLRSMADCARMNAWHQHREKHPGLAKRIAVKSWLNRGRRMNAVSRAQVGALLGGDGLFEQLTRSQK